jgi:glutathione-specific gamma-glutamylcyclotransferase
MMKEKNDPYRHHPDLRGKIVDPLQSWYRNIDLADMDRRMAESGRPANWRRSDENREATRREVLSGRTDRDLWVFAYGSLIWDPGFRFCEIRVATLKGYHRRFCLRTTLGRGTPQQPGLMAGLDTGGQCTGIAYRIEKRLIEAETEIVWRREMLMRSYAPAFVEAQTTQGPIEALAFLVDRDVETYMPDLSAAETARYLGVASGVLGSNIAYLDNLAGHLQILGIVDTELTELLDLARKVADGRSAEQVTR